MGFPVTARWLRVRKQLSFLSQQNFHSFFYPVTEKRPFCDAQQLDGYGKRHWELDGFEKRQWQLVWLIVAAIDFPVTVNCIIP